MHNIKKRSNRRRGCFLLVGCQSAGQHMAVVQSGMTGQNISVGRVQREIRVGMTGATVAEVLGSPNIVTTDE